MLPYFWYLLKVIICSGILFGYYWLFLRNKIFHQYNRFYLLAAMSLSLLLPLLKINFWQPAETQSQAIRVLQAVSVGDEYVSNVVINTQGSTWSFEQLYPMVYWLVSIIFFVIMLRTIFLIRTLLKKYPVQQIEEVSFVNTEDDSTPFSFFKYIFWNSGIDINTTTGRQIFKHEVAHIEEKHTHDKLFVNAVLIFCWCNPFFWLYRKELNMIHEFIADKKAVENSDTAAFAAMILQAAYPRHRFELVNNFFYSPIKRRLLMLTKNNNPKMSYIGRLMVLPLAVLVFAAFTFKAKTNPQTNKVLPSEKPKTIIETAIDPITMYEVADTVPFKTLADIKLDGKQPLYVVNGKETDKTVAENIKPEDIEDVRVIKDAIAIKVYGEKGKNGVIIINTKPGYVKNKWSAETVRIIGNNNADNAFGANPLMIVDNTEYPGKTLDEVTELIGQTKFATIDMYTGEEAIKTFGERAKDGAVVVLTNRPSLSVSDLSSEVIEERKLTDRQLVELKQQLVLQEQNRAKLNYLEKEKVVLGQKLTDQQILNEKEKLLVEVQAANKLNYAVQEKAVLGRKLNEQEILNQKQKLFVEQQAAAKLNAELYEVRADDLELAVKQQKELQALQNNKVFTQVEIKPQFTGGQEAWIKYLRANLKINTIVDNGAKAGTYIVVLKFMVTADGYLSDITCENDPGFGACTEAVRFIKTTPRWQPAIQNGKKVNAYLRQPITFIIATGKGNPASWYKIKNPNESTLFFVSVQPKMNFINMPATFSITSPVVVAKVAGAYTNKVCSNISVQK